MEGRGTYTWTCGDVYVGVCRNDKMEGRGTYTWTDNRLYDGDWKDCKVKCRGNYLGQWRCVFGEYKEGYLNGQGKKTCASGSVIHNGQWRNDKPLKVSNYPVLLVLWLLWSVVTRGMFSSCHSFILHHTQCHHFKSHSFCLQTCYSPMSLVELPVMVISNLVCHSSLAILFASNICSLKVRGTYSWL